MDYRFSTSCNHHGTIKPVQSRGGKHAGKWLCRIQGPVVTAKSMDVKTIYCAPYLGAAKAAIVKFLEITVDTITTTGQSCVLSTGASTPRVNKNSEFDDNDDELAAFDLEAAVSSAKKLPPSFTAPAGGLRDDLPPQFPRTQLKYTSPVVNQNKDTAQKDLDLFKKEKTSLQNDIKAMKQQREVFEIEAKSVQLEVNRLENQERSIGDEIDRLKQEKCRIENDIHQLTKEKDNVTADKKEITRLKDEISTMNKEYSKLKADVEKLKHERDIYEKGAQDASRKKINLKRK